jgi:transcription-repair coupling factor (superfamily II helicase)
MLEIRGAGRFIGEEQKQFINEIGFDTRRLLNKLLRS